MNPEALPSDFTWAPLVPELLVTDLQASLRFWCGVCGFAIAYARPEDGFAYLHRGSAQVMLEEVTRTGRHWITAELEPPLGRGMNLQIEVDALEPPLAALRDTGWPLYLGPEEKWYRAAHSEVGVRQFLVQDPDGYLLRFQQPIGMRPVITPA